MEEYLKFYSENIYPFHMPGHKLGRLSTFKNNDFLKYDVTEVDGTDNLFQSEGIIYDAQKRASDLYDTLETYFLVNGSSSGILSAISACSNPSGKILIARNSHKSVFNGVLINRLNPIYLYPEYIESYQLLGGINPEKVEQMIHMHPEISCVLITSPTYEGFTSDIEAISSITSKHNLFLIVDEAHGAHFKFNEFFPKSALDCGADIVIHSLHKTLPALTQSALIHVNSEKVDTDRLKNYLSIYQSSSPSYILMMGIDNCIKLLKENGEKYFDAFINNIKSFRNSVDGLDNISLISNKWNGNYHIHNIDLSKLLFVGKRFNINGIAVDKILREKYNIQVEMSMMNSFLALTSIADETSGFNKFVTALKELDKLPQMYKYIKSSSNINIIEKSESIYHNNIEVQLENLGESIIAERESLYSPFEAFQINAEDVPLYLANNRICAQFISIYPPGIPIFIPGERISDTQLKLLYEYKTNGFTVIGIEHDMIKVLK